ncbi:hypothetical protein Taro_039132 [Colocasia esculenta]|uniref:Uncharacterized protein n=1 Tax=Colocasia esculenta TaxID=4460 RepID=A0A843WUS4_COLES|nr:hypothetical protein [Colocasia esculenta]
MFMRVRRHRGSHLLPPSDLRVQGRAGGLGSASRLGRCRRPPNPVRGDSGESALSPPPRDHCQPAGAPVAHPPAQATPVATPCDLVGQPSHTHNPISEVLFL